MMRRSRTIVILAFLALLGACQSSPQTESPRSVDAAMTTLANGYGLLYSTISDECEVDKVLIIKDPSPPVAEPIKAIGGFSCEAKAAVEDLSEEYPTIALDNPGLPKVETKTREAIRGATSKQILFSGGKELEFRLLLTQHEALNYITHLAAALADQDPSENRKQFLTELSKRADALHEQVLEHLMAPYIGLSK